MENFIHENGTICFAAESDTVDHFAENMLKFNRMQCIAPCTYDSDKTTIYYNVKGLVSLSDMLLSKRKSSEVLDIISGICCAMKESRLYMLSDKHLIFDERFIFINPEKEKVIMLYAPLLNNDDNPDIAGLMKRILETADGDSEIIHPVNVVLDVKPFSVKLVENVLSEMLSGDDDAIQNDAPCVEDIVPEIVQPSNTPTYAYIIRESNGEKTEITDTNFIVGKSVEYSKYIIRNNKAISRVHATFIIRNGTYYIADNDSKNGTFVNGQRIAFENMAELCDGDVIQLANEKFKFYMK